MRERRGRIESITPVSATASLVGVAAVDPSPVSWRAGQFVSLQIDGAGTRRSYSIVTSAKTSATFELLIAASGPTSGTARFVAGLRPGDEVSYFGPMGYFTYRPGHAGALLFGATGVGISAVLPMLAAAADDPAPAATEIHWSVRDAAGAILRERVEQIVERDRRISMHMYITGSGSGRLTAPLVESITAAADPRVYLCGNPVMIGDVCRGLSAAGVDTGARVMTELFAPPPAPLQL